jgi:hypothetical protein
VLGHTMVECQSVRVLWPEVVTEFVAAGNGNGVPADHGTAEQHLKEGKSAIRWTRYHQPVAPQPGAA